MSLRIPPLNMKIPFESTPLKSRILVRRFAVLLIIRLPRTTFRCRSSNHQAATAHRHLRREKNVVERRPLSGASPPSPMTSVPSTGAETGTAGGGGGTFIYLFVYLSFFLSIYLTYLSIYLSIYIYIYIYVCLSIYLSII